MSTSSVFRIGYLRGDAEAQINGRMIEDLREYLLSVPAVLRAMQEEEIEDIVVQASDSHQNLRDWWMSQNQVDLAFCSALDFVWQHGQYEPLFQFRGRISGENRFFHRGVVFVGNSSDLFRADAPTTAIGATLVQREMAMVSSSAAGYVYPALKIASFTTSTLPQRIIFCESSEEVVKYVLSGVCEAGACERGVFDEVLAQHRLDGDRDKLIRILFETDLIPTDPVALQERWLPRKSPLGRELKRALREFFRHESRPRLEETSSDAYTDLRENLIRFQTLTQRARGNL